METHETNKAELLEKLKAMINKFSAQKTRLESDNVIVEWSGDLSVGTELTAVEGELGAEFQLEDGRKLVIQDGKVAEIVELQEDTETEVELEEEAEEAVEDINEEEVEEFDVEERIASVEGLVNALAERLAVLEGIMAEITEMKRKQEELTSQVTELAKAPAVPAKKKETVSNDWNRTQSRAAKVLGA